MTRAPLKAILAVLLWCIMIGASAWGHSVRVHKRIAAAAVKAAPDLEAFLEDTFGSSPGPKLDGKTAFQWIVDGSEREDDSPRYYNHFYEPLSGSGLTDARIGAALSTGSFPVSSKSWGILHGFHGPGGPNQWAFESARLYEYYALTAQTKTERDQNFGRMFRSLGQVIHLIADLSQPGHTRNDAHGIGFLKNYIEDYGLRYVNHHPYTQQTLDWHAAGFTRIEDFWDHNQYFGTADALNNDHGSTTLGLAEFSNGNFLSEDTTYGAMRGWFSSQTFPFPSLQTSTNYATLKTSLSPGIRQVTLPDGTNVNRLYISKVADGVAVDKHAAVTFLGYKHLKTGKPASMPREGVTLKDDAVLADYHSILIPQAVKYSAGALDYFCRGRLSIRVTWDEMALRYKLQISNDSAQPLKGGAFTLYSDDENGNRSSVALSMATAWNSLSTLDVGAVAEATFLAPSGTVSGYMLVYRGTIGEDGFGNTGDAIDAGKAIAAQAFKLLRFNLTWNPKSDIDLYLVDPDGTIVWYGSKVSELGELDIDSIGNTGPENITLKKVIDGDYQVWANYYADHYIEDPNSQNPDPETPISVTMKTYFNSATAIGTNTFTLTIPNYGEDRPVGTSGPATQASWYIRKLLKVEDGKVTAH